jgi:hypothetical protein
MSHFVDIHLSAPFDMGSIAAQLELEGGAAVDVELHDGRLVAEYARRPLTLRLRGDEGDAPTEASALPAPGVVDLVQLFGNGIALPMDGRLHVHLVLLPACQQAARPGRGTLPRLRFEPAEHSLSAAFVGRVAALDGAAELTFGERVAPAADARLPVGSHRLTFGEIVALAGDFYADFDAAARTAFDWAWPEIPAVREGRRVSLAEDDPVQMARLQELIRREPSEGGLFQQLLVGTRDALAGYALKRCGILAAYNFCHFARPGREAADNPALRAYRAYHARALAQARAASQDSGPAGQASLRAALAVDAFGCHFLTDLFASGHLRVPRRLLQEHAGLLLGGQRSHRMHQEDNARGLWVTTREASAPRVVWHASGDAQLRAAPLHLAQVQEGVRRSAAEVFAAWCDEPWPSAQAAEALLPVALAPGTGPGRADVLPNGGAPPGDARPNHWPLFWFSSEGQVLRRVGDGDAGRYEVFKGAWQVEPQTHELASLT